MFRNEYLSSGPLDLIQQIEAMPEMTLKMSKQNKDPILTLHDEVVLGSADGVLSEAAFRLELLPERRVLVVAGSGAIGLTGWSAKAALRCCVAVRLAKGACSCSDILDICWM